MNRIPIAIQLYSVRGDCARDLRSTLDSIAEMGYEGVEFAGYYDHSAAQLKAMLDECGLKCAGTHTSFNSLRGEELARTIEFNRTLENPYLIVPGLPTEYYQSREKWLEFCGELSEIAARTAEQQMFVGYHNHNVEFKSGENLMEIFLRETPQNVVAQFDLGNATEGGGDCIALMEKYRGRAATIHLKEFKASDPRAFVGEGDVDWRRVFELCESDGITKWYIVEYESDALTPLQAIDRCLQNLRAMGQ